MSLACLARCEVLSEAIATLRSVFLELRESGDACLNRCVALQESIQSKINSLERQIECVQNELQECETACSEALEAERQAWAEVEEARQNLQAATASMSEVSGESSHEEQDESRAQEDYYQAEQELEEAQRAHECAAEAARASEQKRDLVMHTLERLMQELQQCQNAWQEAERLTDGVTAETRSRLSRTEALLDDASRRLTMAQQALDSYLLSSASGAYVTKLLSCHPMVSKPLAPSDLHARLHLSAPQMKELLSYLDAREPSLHAKVNDYKAQLRSCCGSAEVLRVQQKVRKYMSGYLGEAIARCAFRPYASQVRTQKRTYFDDGRYTKVDLLVCGLKVPVILGKGHGSYAPKGGSIGIEVKCGQPSYLYSQKEHMLFQSGGHRDADTAVTLCSADIRNLSDGKARQLRDQLREAGSPMLGMLPSKDDLDAVCWEFVCRPEEEDDSDHE